MVDPRHDWYDIIDNFYPVAGFIDTVLIHRERAGSQLHVNVAAAIAATAGRLKSLDGARRSYIDEDRLRSQSFREQAIDLLRQAYVASLAAIREARANLSPPERGPTLGEFYASIALERLETTMKSVHLLYMLGHRVDAEMVARAVLEQVAWAFVVSGSATEAEVGRVRASASVSKLKQFYPGAGQIYGQLSRSVHLDVQGHGCLATTQPDGRVALHVREDALQAGTTMLLRLTDVWLAVWEATQVDHLPTLNSIERVGGGLALRDDRPFLRIVREHEEKVQRFVRERELEALGGVAED